MKRLVVGVEETSPTELSQCNDVGIIRLATAANNFGRGVDLLVAQ